MNKCKFNKLVAFEWCETVSCRTCELDFDLRGKIELSVAGNFAYIDIGEAKLKLDYAKVSCFAGSRAGGLAQGYSFSSSDSRLMRI